MNRDELLAAIDAAIEANDARRRWALMQQLREAVEPTQPQNLYAALSDLTGRTYGQVAGDLHRARQMQGDTAPRHVPGTQDDAAPHSLLHESEGASTFRSADDTRAMLRVYLGTTREPERFYYHAPSSRRTVAGVGDLHGEFDPGILAEMIRTQADVYVIGGDLGDQQYASVHPTMTKAEKRQQARRDMRQECASVRAGIELLLDETRGEIRCLRGNHDAWTWRKVQQVLPDWLAEQVNDPFELMLLGLGPRVQTVGFHVVERLPDGSQYDGDHRNEFMYVLGDVMFSHLNKTNSITESGVSKLYRMWFVEWDKRLKLDHVRVIVHFHVHARNYHTRRGGYMHLIEPGMGGTLASETYKHGYQPKWKPGIQGFVRFVQYRDGDDWVTDLSSIDMVAPRVTGRAAA